MTRIAIVVLGILAPVAAFAYEATTLVDARAKGIVEVKRPECDCPPIVTLVEGESRTLVSGSPALLQELARFEGQPKTVEGTLERIRYQSATPKETIVAKSIR